ncbi:MAG: hypothetical protein O7H41_15075 [Planctomycetota bacterium]|nr:hypothetical protein [Planctomycetota bacterium]
MRARVRSVTVLVVVLSLSCGGGGGPRKRSPPPVVESASVTIDPDGLGNPISVSFASVTHSYNAAGDCSVITMSSSTPAGWIVEIVWPGDSNPGMTDTSVFGVALVVTDPSSESYFASDFTLATTFIMVDKFAIGDEFTIAIGRETSGTFVGTSEWFTDPFFYLDLTGGTFTAARY